MTTKVASPRARKSFSRTRARSRPPQPHRHPEGLVPVVPGRGPPGDDRRHLADRGLHRHARRRVRRLTCSAMPQFSIKECREKDLTYQAPLSMTVRFVNKDTGEIREQTRLHGRLPDDDRARHVHHQRHRARHRDAARPLAGRLPDGAEGPDEAGLHGEPHAEPRLVARARDRQEGHRLRPHRPQAQAADHDAAPRAPGRGPVDRLRSSTRRRTRRSSPSSTTRTTSSTRSRRTPRRARKRP